MLSSASLTLLQFDCRLENLRRCLKDHYRICFNRFAYYHIGAKFIETIDTVAFPQNVVTLCRAVSFKVINNPQKYRQNGFPKIAETAIHCESKQKGKVYHYLPHQHSLELYIAHSNIISTFQRFKQFHAATFITILKFHVTQSTQERTNDRKSIKIAIVNCIQQPSEQQDLRSLKLTG